MYLSRRHLRSRRSHNRHDAMLIIAYIRLFMLLLLHNFSFLMNNFMQIIEII